MKVGHIIFFIGLIILAQCNTMAQNNQRIDSLKNELQKKQKDNQQIAIIKQIATEFETHNSDSAIFYFNKSYSIATNKNEPIEIADILCRIGIIYKNIGEYYLSIDKFKEASILLEKSKKTIESNLALARIYVNYGETFRYLSHYDKALEKYKTCLEICNNVESKDSIFSNEIKFLKGACYNNIGLVKQYQGDYNEAISNYQQSLNFQKEINNSKSVSNSYTNIGNIHFYQGNYETAIEYYTEALKTFEKIDYKKGIFACLTNIGSVNLYIGKSTNKDISVNLKKIKQAIEYYEKALIISKSLEDKNSIADCLGNLGAAYSEMAFFSDNSVEIYNIAIEYFEKTLSIKKEIEDELGTAICYINISSLHNKKKNYKEAIINANKSLEIANNIGAKQQKITSYDNLYVAHQGLKNIDKAFEYFKLKTQIKDSLFNEKKSKQLAEMEGRFQSEKKQLEIEKLTSEKALQDAEIAVKDEEMKKQKILTISFIIGFLIILIFSGLLLKQFRAKKKANIILAQQKREIEEINEELNQQNEEITAQRDEIEAQRDIVTKHKERVEEIHQELTDSIQYAKRIQTALLPTEEIINDFFPERTKRRNGHQLVCIKYRVEHVTICWSQ
jgi:tetratricopeptide (TPR) repeat protein